jgi:hypothetical protein
MSMTPDPELNVCFGPEENELRAFTSLKLAKNHHERLEMVVYFVIELANKRDEVFIPASNLLFAHFGTHCLSKCKETFNICVS